MVASLELADYSYLAKSAGRYTDDLPPGPPMNALMLGMTNFRRELREMILSATGRQVPTSVSHLGMDPSNGLDEGELPRDASQGDLPHSQEASAKVREQLRQLTLSNAGVWRREEAREQIRSPVILKAPYLFLCLLIDVLFEGRPISRFWFLENVARMPYLSYVSMLHLYESLGWWRRGARVKSIHFAEEWNEVTVALALCLLSLGGQSKGDRSLEE